MKATSVESDIKNVAKATAKTIPVIIGSLAGIFFPANGMSNSPYEFAKVGQTQNALDGLVANYTFYSAPNHSFYANQGLGVKTAVAGGLVSKLIDYIIG